MMSRRMATWLGVVTLGLVGCSADPKGAGGEGAPTTAESSSGSLPPFLDLVSRAKDNTSFRGTRRFRLVNGQGVLEVREDVGADGTGQFAIELLDTFSLLPDTDPVSFPQIGRAHV